MVKFNTSKYFIFAGILLIDFMQMSHNSINGDCVMESRYCVNGLNTEQNNCVAWKNYKNKYEKFFENTTLCKKGNYGYWCPTNDGLDWSYCRPRKCNLPDIICSIDQFWTVHRKSIKLNFLKVSEKFDLIIIISSNPTFSKCSIASNCNHCQSTESLINNLFGSCNRANIMRTNFSTIIVKLPKFSHYTIYILPVLEKQLHGSLYKLSITTSEKVPAVPFDIQFINIEIASMIIRWKSLEETNEFGPSSGYLLKLESPFQENHKLQETNKSMTNLKACTKYCFEIIAFNIAGNSKPSETYCANTKPVFDNISSLSSTRYSDVSVMIQWDYSNKNNCNVKFLVQYFNKFQEKDIISSETTTQNILLQDLSINQYYIVNICPIIDDVKGQISNNLEFHTIQVPKPPNNIRSRSQTKNSITLQWDQIKLEDSNIKHLYKYKIKQNGEFQLITDKLQYKINNLLPCTKYCFTISSINIAGKSEESAPFCAFTKTVPIKIEVLPLEYDKSNSTTIRWQYNNIIKCSFEFKIEYLMKPNILQKSNEITKNNYLKISSIEFNQILSLKIIPFIENEIEEFSVKINLHTAIKKTKMTPLLLANIMEAKLEVFCLRRLREILLDAIKSGAEKLISAQSRHRRERRLLYGRGERRKDNIKLLKRQLDRAKNEITATCESHQQFIRNKYDYIGFLKKHISLNEQYYQAALQSQLADLAPLKYMEPPKSPPALDAEIIDVDGWIASIYGDEASASRTPWYKVA